jgi:MSHA biogenesis protein MshI
MERRVFSFLKPKAAPGVRIGVAFNADQVAVAAVRRPASGRAVLEHCAVVPVAGGDAALLEALRQAGTPRTPVSVLLQTDDYQLALIEAPDVLPAELRAAVRWRLRDAIDFHVDDAVVDVFDVPPKGRHAQGRMMYAVAARRGAVQGYATRLAGWRGFDVVDVPELCLRNLAAQLPAADQGVALLHLGETSASVVLVRGPTLYLARQMPLQFLAGGAEGEAPAVDSEAVALELQRSLDYYESHYDQPPIGQVMVAPAGARAAALAAGLARETGLAVQALDLGELLDCAEPPSDALQADCLLAVAAALREDTKTL